MSGTIEIHLADLRMLAFKAKVRCRVLIDGEEAGIMRIGDTAGFPVPEGEHEVRVAMDLGPITRRTKRLLVRVFDNTTVRVTGQYSRVWGKYAISVST